MKYSRRRIARECAVQAIYSWQLSENNISDIYQQSLEYWNFSHKDIDLKYFKNILYGVVEHKTKIDSFIIPHILYRKIKDLGLIELAILRISIFEIKISIEIPYKVLINEAIEITKIFGAQDSHKFINGVLDKVIN